MPPARPPSLRARPLGALVLGVSLALCALSSVARADDPTRGQSPRGAPLAPATPRSSRLDASWILEQTIAAHGFRIARYRQEHDGLRVEGAHAIVRARSSGLVDLVTIETPLPEHLAQRFARRELEAASRERLRARLDVGFEVTSMGPSESVLADVASPLEPPRLALAYRLEVAGAALHERASVLVDAASLRVLRVDPRFHDARGLVYERNAVSDAGATSEVELPALRDPGDLANDAFISRSCEVASGGACNPVSHATPDDDGDFLYAPDPSSFEDGFAEVMAYYHANLAADRLEAAHGFRWRCPVAGASTADAMRIFVNYTDTPFTAFPNAGFVGSTRGACGYLVFGQAGAYDFASDADVIYHELAHAMTDQLAGMVGFATDALALHYEPLAINEGTSDYWAATLQGDPHIGESLAGLDGLLPGSSLRDLDGALACPNDLVGEGHLDGRVWAGALWELRERLGAEKVDALVFATIASSTDNPTLRVESELLLSTASGLEAMGTLDAEDVAAVRERLTARGLLDCRRIVALDDGAEHLGFSGIGPLTRGPGAGIAPIHYTLTLPADATDATVTIASMTSTGRYVLHARRDQPVARRGGIRDDQAEEIGRSRTVVLGASDAAFAPCTTLYLAIETTDLAVGESLYAIHGSVTRSGDPSARCPEPTPDAGLHPEDPGAREGSCGCRVVGGDRTPAPAPSLLTLTLLAFYGARRRRARLAHASRRRSAAS